MPYIDDLDDAKSEIARLLVQCDAQQNVIDSLRTQLHTQIEQRQFIGDLVGNMPHAQIAAELDAERKHSTWLQSECDKAVDALYRRNAEVAAALGGLRAKLVKQPGQDEYNAAIEDARDHLDATIAALGLKEKDGRTVTARASAHPHLTQCHAQPGSQNLTHFFLTQLFLQVYTARS